MMYLPTPPTDNLYKLAAIFGLIILLASSWYPFSKASDMKREKITLETESEIISSRISALRDEFEQAKASQQKGDLVNIDFLQTRLSTINEERIRLKGKERQVLLLETEVRLFLHAGRAGTIIGFILMAIGFTCWYTKVQKWQDKALKNPLSADS